MAMELSRAAGLRPNESASDGLPGDTDWRFGGQQERPRPERITEATRSGYQDERIPIERLLDSEGFLRHLSPAHQRRKVWEAWKHAHGLRYLPRSDSTPFGLDVAAVESLSHDERIHHDRPRSHGDERAREATELVDRLFEVKSSVERARLLPLIGLTFDGLRSTSLRRQLVDVLGSHLVGLDDDPHVSYTGQHLTQHERVAAAAGLRQTRSPHVLYYLEKFAEGSGRTFHYRQGRGIGNFATVAVVREAVVRAVVGLLEDFDRNTYFATRRETWRLREFATDVGKLYRRLVRLNAHLCPRLEPARHRRRLPLPAAAHWQPLVIQSLWSQLTGLTDQEWSLLRGLLRELSPPAVWEPESEVESASYVERTRELVQTLRVLDDADWAEFRRRLASTRLWHVFATDFSELLPEVSLGQRIIEEVRLEVPSANRGPSLWGERQRRDLERLLAQAERLLTPLTGPDAPSVLNQQRHAVTAIAEILDRHRAVACVWTAFVDEAQRARRGLSDTAAAESAEQYRDQVRSAGGPGGYFQIHNRPPRDPGRIVYEMAATLLATVMESQRATFAAPLKHLTAGHLAELGDCARGLLATVSASRPAVSTQPAEQRAEEFMQQLDTAARSLEEHVQQQILRAASEILGTG